MISAILAAAVLLADTTATLQAAPDAAAKPAAAASKKQNDPTALVCKSEPVLGTRLATKHCRTQAQIDAQKLEDRQALERAQTVAKRGGP